MLSLDEFSVGRLRDARPMSLLMPSNKYQATFLVVGLEDNELFAVFLDGQHAFRAFNCTTNTAWNGMLVHSVSIEVDETSIFDPGRFDAMIGSLVRKGDTLSIMAVPGEGFPIGERCKLVGGLPIGHVSSEIGFSKWRIVTGIGQDKRTLFTVDRPKPKND